LFLDRTHQSKVTKQLLTDLGTRVEVHKRHYLPATPDPEWVADTTRKGWTIISGDKGIESDGINKQAVIQAEAKIFLLTDTESRGAEWAASLVMARHKIQRIATENRGPFYCTIDKGGDGHVRDLRFLAGGGPLIGETQPLGRDNAIPPTTTAATPAPATNPPRETQTKIEFPD
jgi:hypothetical protein